MLRDLGRAGARAARQGGGARSALSAVSLA